MLYIVLVLVLAALGLLVTALITATSLWAWVSIGLSVLAGIILVADWLRRRRRADRKPEPAEAPEGAEAEEAAEPETAPTPAAPAEERQTELLPAAGGLTDEPAAEPANTEVLPKAEVGPKPEEKPKAEDTTGEPGEEPTSAEDLAVVSELDDGVVVVDEFPRYHLTDCGWLGGRDTIPIGVGEARQLGFTPCARCKPDTTLAAAQGKPQGRSKSKSDS